LLITDLVCIASFFLFFWKLCPLIFIFFAGNLWVFFYAIHVWNFLWVISVFWVCFVFVFVLLLRKSSGFFLILINMDGNGYSEIKFCNINTWTRNQNFYPNLIGYKPNLTLLSFRYSWSICWGIHWASVEYPCTNLNHSRQCWILMKEN
jgi:hypothetical protein